MARFVILRHDWPAVHWDFLAETGGELRAWRLLSEPGAGCEVAAEPNAPHRLLYLDYEGPVSGNRGSVSRWDAGTCDWLADDPGRVEIALQGATLVGRAVIHRAGGAWTFRLV